VVADSDAAWAGAESGRKMTREVWPRGLAVWLRGAFIATRVTCSSGRPSENISDRDSYTCYRPRANQAGTRLTLTSNEW
jgi:hypothetical protein